MTNMQLLGEKRLVEEFGIAFEQTGLPRMAGRIFGWLLVADSPHQSASQLAEALTASKGSISTSTRLLIRIGLIERLSLPGVRHDYFRLCPDWWQRVIRHGLEDEIMMFRRLAERGLQVVGDKNPVGRKCLENMRDIYAFLEREFPSLLARWEQKPEESKLRAK